MLHAVLLAALVANPGASPPTYGPLPAASPTAQPDVVRTPVAAGEALIEDSGSTNRAGYRLRVYAKGWTALQQGDVTLKKRVPRALVTRFFADLRAAGPLDALPAATCMKSASFGSATQIAYRGKTSPDLSCPSTSPAARTLAIDADALAEAAGVSLIPHGMPAKP